MPLDISQFTNNCTKDCLFKSKVYPAAIERPCILGVDEAGRGPVCGPMVYGIAYYPENVDNIMKKEHFADSKSLTETSREKIFSRIESDKIENFGWMAVVISPTTISNQMLKRKKYNLNLLSHDSAMMLIQQVIDAGVKVKKVFLDTVGPEKKYEDKLKAKFPNVEFKVSKKADSLYTVVSASSICAKVIRDRIVCNWPFPDHDVDRDYGSGYPADPKTQAFLHKNLDKIFGFPSFIRFSWSTANEIIEKKAVECHWPDSDDDDNSTSKKKQKTLKQMLKPSSESQNTNLFFKSRCLARVKDLNSICYNPQEV